MKQKSPKLFDKEAKEFSAQGLTDYIDLTKTQRVTFELAIVDCLGLLIFRSERQHHLIPFRFVLIRQSLAIYLDPIGIYRFRVPHNELKTFTGKPDCFL